MRSRGRDNLMNGGGEFTRSKPEKHIDIKAESSEPFAYLHISIVRSAQCTVAGSRELSGDAGKIHNHGVFGYFERIDHI